MVYNNYPGYQPNYYYPQQRSNARIWVQGEEGAKSYLVAPNTSVDLWDSEKAVIYVKSADASGVPSMAIIDYSFRDNAPKKETKDEHDFVTKKELKELRSYFDKRMKEIGGGEDDDE